MGDGFARVAQHLVPVISAQALGHVPHSTHADDLVMADTVDDRRFRSFETTVINISTVSFGFMVHSSAHLNANSIWIHLIS